MTDGLLYRILWPGRATRNHLNSDKGFVWRSNERPAAYAGWGCPHSAPTHVGTMPLRRLSLPLVPLAFAAIAACSGSGGITTAPPAPTLLDTMPPAIQREMRGLWIATVANIDWPSRSGLPAAQQQAELVDILDRASVAGLNAVMFHIRPAADAVYSSSIEPWASMLTGKQGTDPGYDPLAFAVTEA